MTGLDRLMDEACWAACPYVRQWVDKPAAIKECQRCPAVEEFEDRPKEKHVRMCRAIAQEVVEPVLKAVNAYKQSGENDG